MTAFITFDSVEPNPDKGDKCVNEVAFHRKATSNLLKFREVDKPVELPSPDKRDKCVNEIISCQKNAKNNFLLTKKEVLYPKELILKRVKELAGDISRDYEGKELIIIGILKGAFIFMADLIRCLTIPCQVDFVRLASYGSGAVSSGKVVMTKDIETSIKDREILIVEDVVDTGLTLTYLVNWLQERSPRSLKVCALLDKRKRRKVDFEADYVGFIIDEDRFVVGYGLDFNEKARFLPDICVLKDDTLG